MSREADHPGENPSTSAAKRAANRRNAQRSTGPKSAAGKAISAQNARRHGFSTPVVFEGELPEPYETLARGLAAGRSELLAAARIAAEQRFNLDRIAAANRLLIAKAMGQLRGVFPDAGEETLEAMARVEVADELARRERYARALRAKWRKASRAFV